MEGLGSYLTISGIPCPASQKSRTNFSMLQKWLTKPAPVEFRSVSESLAELPLKSTE